MKNIKYSFNSGILVNPKSLNKKESTCRQITLKPQKAKDKENINFNSIQNVRELLTSVSICIYN